MLDPGAIKRIRAGFRVPVDSSHPAAYWIISLDVDSLMPTDEELALLKSYQEFLIEAAYNEHFAERLKRLELPKCVGHNTVVFRKGSHLEGTDNHWFYRRASWINGPTYVPYALSEDYKPHTLRIEYKIWCRKNGKDGKKTIKKFFPPCRMLQSASQSITFL